MSHGKQRIVIDTNIIISFILNNHSLPGQVIQSVLADKKPLLSDAVKAEFLHRIFHQKFDRYASTEKRNTFFKILLLRSETITPTTIITDCRDPKDNKFLELAVDGQADCIVTGDQDLLVLSPFRGIPILSAREFLEGQKNR